MVKRFFIVFALTVIFSAAGVSAQTKACAVKIDVTQPSGASISGATAAAVNLKTKIAYRSTVKSGMPFFRRLPAGNYRVTVTKADFFRTADDYSLDCGEPESAWNIELTAGNSRQIVRLYNRPKRLVRIGDTNALYSVGSSNETADVPKSSDPDEVPPPPPKRPPPPPLRVPKIINGGVINGKAVNLVKPSYPAAASAVRAGGAVNVQVTIDESGRVISASAVSGHPLLRAAAVQAARASTFSPTLLSGQPVKVTGIIVYNFVP